MLPAASTRLPTKHKHLIGSAALYDTHETVIDAATKQSILDRFPQS